MHTPKPAGILLVTPYFWPEVAASVPLMAALAEDLVADGHRVTVLTSRPRTKEALEPEHGGARVIRLPNPFARARRTITKLLDYAWFGTGACVRALFRRGDEVYFVSSNPPLLGLPLALIARVKGARVVYNLQDLFPKSAIASGLLREESRAVRFFERLERSNYRNAGLVIAISGEFREHVYAAAPTTPVEVVENWVDVDVMKPVPHEQNELRRRLGLHDRLTVLYAGSFGYLHDVPVLIEAAARIPEANRPAFVFVGDGRDREEAERRARSYGIDPCHFLGYQPHELLAQVYSAGDIGVVTMRRGAGRVAVPSKTWNIMACARAVVAVVEHDTELARVVLRSGAGVVVPPEDPARLAAALAELAANPDRRRAMGESGRRYVSENLARRPTTARYSRLIANLAVPTGKQIS